MLPESHIKAIVRKVAEILEIQGISCCRCPKTNILSPLSACDSIYLYSLRQYYLPLGKAAYQLELKLKPVILPSPTSQAYSASAAYLYLPSAEILSSVERRGCIMAKKITTLFLGEAENNLLYHDTYKLLQ